MIYAGALRTPPRGLAFVIESDREVTALAAEIERAVRSAAPAVSVYDLASMNTRLAENTARSELLSRFMAVFAAIALTLALVGVYGIMDYHVVRRRTEFGMRRAMGATSGDIARLVLANGARVTLAGLLVGTVLAAASSRVLVAFLAEVSPRPTRVRGSGGRRRHRGDACLPPRRPQGCGYPAGRSATSRLATPGRLASPGMARPGRAGCVAADSRGRCGESSGRRRAEAPPPPTMTDAELPALT